MGDLLEYFEARSRSLDNMEATSRSNCPIETKYTSCIRFNGVPILPPVMTNRRKEEMQSFRRQAMKRENTRKSRNREQLVAKVQSIVAEVEERRGQRASSSGASSPAGSDTSSSRLSPGYRRKIYSRSSPSQQRSIPERFSPSQGSQRSSERESENAYVKSDTGSGSKKESRHIPISKQQKSSLLNVTSKVKSKSLQDISKMGESEWTVVDQRSGAESHNVKVKSGTQNSDLKKKEGKSQNSKGGGASKIPKQSSALNNLKRASSMSSLPNLAKIQGIPVPKPPTSPVSKQQQRRMQLGMSGQYSISNPDLRMIDKSDSENSKSEESPVRKRKKLLKSAQHSVSDPDISHVGMDSDQFVKVNNAEQRLVKPKATSSTIPVKEKKNQPEQHGQDVSKTDSKELKTDQVEEGRLDSLNDFPSLEECTSLPQEFGGMPLSSVRQQQISHVLAKLSKCLNIQDTLSTLASTTGSAANEMDRKSAQSQGANTGRPDFSQRLKVGTSVTSVHSSDRDSITGLNQVHSDGSVSSNTQTPPSHDSSTLSSAPSSSGAGNNSYTSSSSGPGIQHQRRMSPKGGKSKVHFASFLTEISTSASQSLEGRISVRKMDITPQNSPHVSLDMTDGAKGEDCVDGAVQQNLSLQIPPKNLYDLGSRDRPQGSNSESLLSKVALSPENSESPGTPRDFFSSHNGLPFHGYGGDMENNTSDKENEYHDRVRVSASSGFEESERTDPVIVVTNASISESQGTSVKSSTKSLNSDEGSQCSTLKASQDLLGKEGARQTLGEGGVSGTKMNIPHGKALPVTKAMESVKEQSNGPQKLTIIPKDTKNPASNDVGGGKIATRKEENDSPTTDEDKSSKQIFKPGHARKGSYTLQQPSPVLLQAASQDFTTSNGMQSGSSQRSVQRKLNMDHVGNAPQGPHSQVTQENISLHSSAEEEGKAEHIQRYLSHVQNHTKRNNPSKSARNQRGFRPEGVVTPPLLDISDAVQSFTASLQTVEDMSEEEMLKIQTEHFSKLREILIQQQKQQLEELFVQQRREQLQLQEEISSFQEKIKDSQSMDLEHSPENNLAYSTEEPVRDTQKPLNASHIRPESPHNLHDRHYAYMPSPSLYFNPKDRDNNSDISTFSRTTPKQSLQFVNHSTPSPKNFKPVERSPTKKPSIAVSGRLHIPQGAYYPEMKPCFDRVSACVKGYLTRRLLKTEKVQEIIKTIQDTKQFAYSFQSETPIRRGQFSNQDRYLLDRIIAQLQSGLLDIHEIFFVIPVWERMSIIAQSRQLHEEKRLRESGTTRSSVSSSQPRISSATLKAMERKRRAHEAELAVFGDNTRPKSAPPNIASQRKSQQQQSMDLSGPIRRQYHFLLSRALRPLQGHGITSKDGSNTTRERPRPHTALGASTKQQTAAKTKKTSVPGKTTAKPSSTTTTKAQKVVATSKPKSKPSGAWR